MSKRGLNEEAATFIDDYVEHVEKQYEHLKDVKWVHAVERDSRKAKYDIIKKIAKSSLERLKYFASVTEEKEREYAKSKAFISLILELIRDYVIQCKDYLSSEDWTIYPSLLEDKVEKNQNEEIDFQNDILESVNKFNVEVTKLNLDNEIRNLVIPIHGDKLAPLLMRNSIINRFPILIEYIEQKELEDVLINRK